MSERLAWAISAVACGLLAFSASGNANAYQTRVDTEYYKMSGDLRLAWMKPTDGMNGGLSVLAIAGCGLSVWRFLNVGVASSDEPAPATSATTAEPVAAQPKPPAKTPAADDDDESAASSSDSKLSKSSETMPSSTAVAATVSLVTAPPLDLTSGTTAEKVNRLLDALAADGMPIRRLLKKALIWAYGPSQSGKSTIVNLLNVCRSGLGYEISYATTDDDYPQLRWKVLAEGVAPYRKLVRDLVTVIHVADKGSMENSSFTLDEFYKASREVDMNKFMSEIIGKGAKSKAKCNIISQVDTLSAHGLEGLREAIDNSRVLIAPIRQEDAEGEEHPTGLYTVKFPNGKSEAWSMPDWILTDTNQYGEPCPVTWVLNRIPELGVNNVKQQRQQQPEQPEQQRQQQPEPDPWKE